MGSPAFMSSWFGWSHLNPQKLQQDNDALLSVLTLGAKPWLRISRRPGAITGARGMSATTTSPIHVRELNWSNFNHVRELKIVRVDHRTRGPGPQVALEQLALCCSHRSYQSQLKCSAYDEGSYVQGWDGSKHGLQRQETHHAGIHWPGREFWSPQLQRPFWCEETRIQLCHRDSSRREGLESV